MNQVSIIVINFNTFEITCNCIRSIIGHTIDMEYEIILVDNASTECNPERFKEMFPNIIFIKSDVNLGFAKGNNLGIEKAKGGHVLLLNSDTILKENSVKTTLDYLISNPKVAVVSSRLIFPDGKHQSCCQRFPSIRYQLFELFRFNKLVSKKKAGKILLGSFFNHDENMEVDWVWGTYFMFRKDLLALLPNKKLNEDYFMYCEDMQWCLDFRNLGYQIHFCAVTEVIHLMGGSAGYKNEMMKKNHQQFLQKNYNPLHRGIIQILSKILNGGRQ